MCGEEYYGIVNLNFHVNCIMSEFQRVAGPASRPKENGDRLHVLVQVCPLMHALSSHCHWPCSTYSSSDAGTLPFYHLLGRQAALSGLQLLPCWGTPGVLASQSATHLLAACTMLHVQCTMSAVDWVGTRQVHMTCRPLETSR